MQISKITNANVYIDGSLNLLGKAKQITLPELTTTVETHKALGMIGNIEYPVGLDAMVTKISWHGFYPEALSSANPFASHKLQVKAPVQRFGAGGLEETVALTVFLTVAWKKSPIGVFGPSASSDTEDELMTTYCRVKLGSDVLVEVDAHENIWKIKGVDVLAEYRKALGG